MLLLLSGAGVVAPAFDCEPIFDEEGGERGGEDEDADDDDEDEEDEGDEDGSPREIARLPALSAAVAASFTHCRDAQINPFPIIWKNVPTVIASTQPMYP